jgi:GTPase SAR1 family protein
MKLIHIKLVVVGDQSSGKSSVLEGLTNLPFPRDSGLCTRFPTQIVFKRSEITSKEVSIMAAHSQETSRADAIAKFGKRQLTSLDEKFFSELLAQVKKSYSHHVSSIMICVITGFRVYGPS